MKTAVIYARYSSENQTEQSIEGQLRVCNEYAKRNDILIVDTYIDRAMSGTNDNRRDFQRMLYDSNKRSWDFVLVYKLDRFSRNKYEMAMHKKTLRDNGVKVLSVMENIPDTPEGIILESLLEGMAEYYSAELSQKVLRGLNESYIKGHFTGGHLLYGYDVVEKKCIINEQEAEVVREVFIKYSDGYTVVSIVASLKARGITDKKESILPLRQFTECFRFLSTTEKLYFRANFMKISILKLSPTSFGLRFRKYTSPTNTLPGVKKKFTILYFQVSLYAEIATNLWWVKAEQANQALFTIIILAYPDGASVLSVICNL